MLFVLVSNKKITVIMIFANCANSCTICTFLLLTNLWRQKGKLECIYDRVFLFENDQNNWKDKCNLFNLSPSDSVSHSATIPLTKLSLF